MSESAHLLQHIEHGIPPVFDGRSEVLVLGTMPSPASREAAFFYGHPQNRFWRVLAALFDEPVPEDNAERADLLLRHHIALWDVLESCDIRGASDASIANPVANDLARILRGAPVCQVFCTGAVAAKHYARLCEPACGMAAVKLPSPSPANAAWSLSRLVEAYRPVAEAVTPFDPPVLDVPDVIALEQAVAEAGTPLDALMRRAGRFLAYEARKMLSVRGALGTFADAAGKAREGSGTDDAASAVVFCGNGNNGGDGWVAAEYLDAWGFSVRVVTALSPGEIAAEPARAAALRAAGALSARSSVIVRPSCDDLRTLLGFNEDMPRPALIVDAILGTGFSHATVRSPFDGWIRAINEARASGALVVAADVPSGLSAQTAHAAADTVTADVTVTMIVSKPGLVAPGARVRCGRVRVAPLAYIEPLLEGKRGCSGSMSHRSYC